MKPAILLLQQVYSLLAEAKHRELLLQTLTKSSVSPTVVNLPTVGNPIGEINCLEFTASADFPSFNILELGVNNFRHIEDIPIDISAILVPINDPATRGYSAEKHHFLKLAYAQRLHLWAVLSWLKKHIHKPIIIICIRNGLNGLDANELLDPDLVAQFEVIDFYVDDSFSFIRSLQSLLGTQPT